jgi:outer membrane lipopolysaccharide assembly protein LptE/RlpB
MARTLVALGMAFLLVGCGFRPAGTLALDRLANTQVEDLTGRSEVAFELAQQLDLEARGRREDAPALRLRILEERYDERPLTITSGARVGEFELIATLRFDLLGEDGAVLLAPQTLTTDALYLRDQGQLLGSREEARTLKSEMRARLARRVLQAAMIKATP